MVRRPVCVHSAEPTDAESTDEPGFVLSRTVAPELHRGPFAKMMPGDVGTSATGSQAELKSTDDRAFEF